VTLTIGSLFSGAAGLDRAVESVLDARTAWHAEIDPAACKVLAHRYPDVPNLGDVTGIDWATVPPVDVICGGSPCQDVSHAGQRRGMRAGTRSGLWAAMCDAIDIIRPALVIWENVRGVLSAEADSAMEPCAGCVGDADDGAVLRALGRVVGDLASIGYVGRWHGLRAADVGAPHGRFRVFVVAWPADADAGQPAVAEGVDATALVSAGARAGAGDSAGRDATRAAADGDVAGLEGRRLRRRGRTDERVARQDRRAGTAPDAAHVGHERRRPARDGWTGPEDSDRTAPDATGDGRNEGRPEPARIVGRPDAAERGAVAPDADGASGETLSGRPGAGNARRLQPVVGGGTDWGQYEPAIRRWEHVLGRPAPAPTELAPRGGQRLSPRFVEWMLGWPDGWVTDVPGVSRNDALKICGNGVVTAQAAEALRRMLTEQAVAA
jgi:DNA (cytosine-5)-methyltransferase 1